MDNNHHTENISTTSTISTRYKSNSKSRQNCRRYSVGVEVLTPLPNEYLCHKSRKSKLRQALVEAVEISETFSVYLVRIALEVLGYDSVMT